MSNKQPDWMKRGKSNRDKLDISTLKRITIPGNEFKNVSSNFNTKYMEKSGKLELSEHLIDLWVVLRKVAKVVFATTIIILLLPSYQDGVITYKETLVLQILNFIILFSLDSISGINDAEVFIGSPMTLISLYINLAFFLASIVSIPLVIKELVDFIRPGITQKEYETLKQTILSGGLLFVVGAAISYFVILPIMLKFLVLSGGIIGQQQLLQLYSLSSLINLLLWGTLGGGLLYASPMILVALVNLGVIEPDQIRNRRKEIYFAVFLLAALVTVDPTLISMIILTLPMMIIVEGVIIWCYRVQLQRILQEEINSW